MDQEDERKRTADDVSKSTLQTSKPGEVLARDELRGRSADLPEWSRQLQTAASVGCSDLMPEPQRDPTCLPLPLEFTCGEIGEHSDDIGRISAHEARKE